MTDTQDAPVQAPRFSWRGFGITSGILFLIFITSFVVSVFFQTKQFEVADVFIAFLVSVFSAVIYGAMIYFPIVWVRRANFNQRRIEQLTRSSEILQGASLEEDFVTNLVRINFKYIDAYYLQTRIQADKSFTVTVFAAAVSLALIFIGIGLMFLGGMSATPTLAGTTSSAGIAGSFTGNQATAAATLSAVAGILGQFISAVFFYLYNQTVAKMADYHRKLVFTQNIGLALKISDGLPAEEKTKAQLALIETLSKDINQYLGS
jgi:TRADD-N domain-containing protein